MNTYGILWDLDGVLADSTQLHYQSWVHILGKRGLILTKERFRNSYGQNNRAALESFLGRPPSENELVEIGDEKEAWFREHLAGNMKLFPGVLLWLERFQRWGFYQAVASSAPQENIEAQVDRLGIRPFFHALVSGARLPGKPNPDVFLLAAKTLGVEPARCLVIEDAPAGVEGACRAGIRCVAVLTTHKAQALAGAALIIKRLIHLKEMDVRQLLELTRKNDQGFCGLVAQTRPSRYK